MSAATRKPAPDMLSTRDRLFDAISVLDGIVSVQGDGGTVDRLARLARQICDEVADEVELLWLEQCRAAREALE